jgi:hypothetical protein
MATKFCSTLFCIMTVLLTTSALQADSVAQGDPEFKLIILRQDWLELGLRYTYAEALPKLEEVDLADSLMVITLDDIETYDWIWQTITLTEEATTNLLVALTSSQEPGDGIQALNDLKASLGWGNPLERALYTQAFVVMLDDKLLYGGIFLDAISQMAIDYPVIRSEIKDDRVVFHIMPIHLPFLTVMPVSADADSWDEFITDEAAGDWAQFSDSFKSWFETLASSESARTFQSIVSDEAIRQVMEAADKLRE